VSRVAAITLLATMLTASSLSLSDLRVEYLVAPLGVDVAAPRFSWILQDNTRGANQTAYQIVVKKSGEVKPLWDSGRVNSSTNYLIAYAGPALISDTGYEWTVKIQGSGGTAEAQDTFRTGLFKASDWTGEWITGGTSKLLRSSFVLPSGEDIAEAHAYVSGIGYYQLYCNGVQVGDHKLDVGWTDYSKRVLYSSYSLGDCLKADVTNVFGIELGNGWFGNGSTQPGHHNAPPQVLMQAIVRYKSGKVENIVTSTSGKQTWKSHVGPITYDSLYNGEHYDARLELPGWSGTSSEGEAVFDDKDWKPVQKATDSASSAVLASQLFEPIRRLTTMKPQTVTEPKPGMYVVDFGQNFAGWIRLYVKGARGQNITIRHAELKMHPPYGKFDGTLYYGNLRGAQATDIYTLRGDSTSEMYEPRFTQHGFRFCEITGLTNPLQMADIIAFEVRTDLEQTGSAEFSSDLLNKIQQATVWGQKSNVMSVPTDCDNRDERRGWMGDAGLISEEATYNFGTGAFYTAWLNSVQDDQGADGHTTNFVPSIGASGAGAPNWQSAYPTLIWTIYRYHGDERLVQKHWPSLKLYASYWAKEYKKHGIANFDSGFGDWVPAGPKANGHLTGAFAYLHDLGLLEELAVGINDTAAASEFKAQRATVAAAFHKQWYVPSKSCYGTCLQSENAFALWADVVPKDALAGVINQTAHDILTTNKVHTTSGIIGIKAMFEVMSRLGRADLPVLMTQQTTYPSYGYMVQGNKYEPATTLWELWNSDTQGPGMNSRNHIMFGTVSSWFYRYLCGIDVPKGSKGYDSVSIRPVGVGIPGADLTSATCEVGTPHGPVRSSWTGPLVPATPSPTPPTHSDVNLYITIPVGVKGTVRMPLVSHVGLTPKTVEIYESRNGAMVVWKDGAFVAGPAGISAAEVDGDGVVFTLASGLYVFTAKVQNDVLLV